MKFIVKADYRYTLDISDPYMTLLDLLPENDTKNIVHQFEIIKLRLQRLPVRVIFGTETYQDEMYTENYQSSVKIADSEFLTEEQILTMKEAFEDGWVAEAIDFILEEHVDLNDLYGPTQQFAEDQSFWSNDLTIKALTIKLFYSLIKELPALNVNGDIDLSVNYWIQQATSIMDKVLVDRSEVNS